MKKLILLSLLIFSLSEVSAQTAQPVGNNDIPPCMGTNNSKPLDLADKSIMFNQAGVNLTKYDWTHQTINCHINEAIKDAKESSTMKTIGWSLLGIGSSLLISGIIMESSYSPGSGSGSLLQTQYTGPRGTSGMPLIVIGGLMTGTSIPVFIGGTSSKKKKDAHMRAVMDYYQKKGW